jgi:hypothetical protein
MLRNIEGNPIAASVEHSCEVCGMHSSVEGSLSVVGCTCTVCSGYKLRVCCILDHAKEFASGSISSL